MDYVIEYALKALLIVVVFGLVFVGSMVIWDVIHGETVKLGVTCHNVIIGKSILVQCVPSPT